MPMENKKKVSHSFPHMLFWEILLCKRISTHSDGMELRRKVSFNQSVYKAISSLEINITLESILRYWSPFTRLPERVAFAFFFSLRRLVYYFSFMKRTYCESLTVMLCVYAYETKDPKEDVRRR